MPSGRGTVRSVNERSVQQGFVAANYVVDNNLGSKVAVIYDKTAYGKGLADEFKKQLNARGVEEAMYEAITAGDKDFTALITKMKQAGVDLIYLGGYHTEAGLITRQAREQGLEAVMVSGDALVTDEYWAITGDTGQGTLMTFSPDPRKNPAAAPVVAEFEAGGFDPEGYTLYTYATIQAWAEAVEKAGTTDLEPVVGISSDMTGQSQEKTGAIALLERMPDPGALTPLAPDEHTPWGAQEVEQEKLTPNGLAVIARCGLGDAGAADGGAWRTAEHPWEGGSDHDVFIERGLPAVLFWHFTDFTYHTSLDRLQFVDVDELRRTAVALTATALALCDPRPGDLDRYLRTLEKERVLRVRAARDAGEPELAAMWERWCDQARQWLRAECLRIAPPGVRPGS